MHHPRARRRALAVAAVLGLVACSSSDAAAPPTPDTIGGVGALPGTLPSIAPVEHEPASVDEPFEAWEEPTVTVPEDIVDSRRALGRYLDGNRVLVIGDSILASISNRYGNQLCDLLVPRGWVVQVDAEVSRFIEFGRHVLDAHEGERWDVAVVMLGSNYDGNAEAFAHELGLLLDELAPRPVVLVNVTRFEPEQDEVNFLLGMAAAEREGVRLLDWAARTADDAPAADELLAGDGVHLSPEGQDALARLIASTLGWPADGGEGECLTSRFDDDSGGQLPSVDEEAPDTSFPDEELTADDESADTAD